MLNSLRLDRLAKLLLEAHAICQQVDERPSVVALEIAMLRVGTKLAEGMAPRGGERTANSAKASPHREFADAADGVPESNFRRAADPAEKHLARIAPKRANPFGRAKSPAA